MNASASRHPRAGPRGLSVFVPMHNERANLWALVPSLAAALRALPVQELELLAVDDGSTDGSGMLFDALARECGLSDVRVLRHPRNLGYGAALRTGLRNATKEAIFYTDADLPARLDALPEALSLLAEADLVVGYRRQRVDGARRRAYSRGYNLLMRGLFGVRVRDVNFSFKLLRRDALALLHLDASTVFIDGQLLAEAVRAGLVLREVPIEALPRAHGSSHFDGLRVPLATLEEMLRYKLRRA